ncbi:MAG: YcaQ family DNA glycosylase [FCB group bacterium]|nr:YcaQ family DNA glycosylase [FCB group bacterium]MBL7027328.1 YcaQ family DNA glycosylase [Candidatus Neomarinimicrobiota bacterium]MBL7122298.1 YcaQ family DNA glycosylase [Candidatus Neomarinimicrobiota bacterium]
MRESLSTQQARKLVLLSQRLPPVKQTGSAISATLSAIEHLGYIQIDTISAVQRAHHHTLWSRNPRYQQHHLDQLVRDSQVFEYWSHAASYLPMRDYRFSLPRKKAIASGALGHWYKPDHKLMNLVLKRITNEGPLKAKDFVYTGKKVGVWESKPAKRALEVLFQQGQLMSPHREGFHKVYDLTERVLPSGVDTTLPDTEEYARFLITRYLRANGLGLASEISYLTRNMKQPIADAREEMVSEGELIPVGVNGKAYYALPGSLDLLDKPLARRRLKILSPFDNLVIQRKRMQDLFSFDYLLECYYPAAKRKYGYFVLPILWKGKLVARVDCKADRKTKVLHVKHLALESGLKLVDAFALALSTELELFTKFNGCNNVQIHRTTPNNFKLRLAN